MKVAVNYTVLYLQVVDPHVSHHHDSFILLFVKHDSQARYVKNFVFKFVAFPSGKVVLL